MFWIDGFFDRRIEYLGLGFGTHDQDLFHLLYFIYSVEDFAFVDNS